MMLTDYMCQEERKEDDFPALKLALTHRENDLKTILKSTEEDRSQSPEIMMTTRGSADRK